MATIDFSLYPDEKYQLKWISNYLKAYHQKNDIPIDEIRSLYVQVCKFALVSFKLIHEIINYKI